MKLNFNYIQLNEGHFIHGGGYSSVCMRPGGSIPESFLSYTSSLSREIENVNRRMVKTYCANTKKTKNIIVLLTSDSVDVRRILREVKETIHQGE